MSSEPRAECTEVHPLGLQLPEVAVEKGEMGINFVSFTAVFGCHTVFVSNMNSYFDLKKQFFSHPFIVMYYIFSAHFTMMSKVHVTCMMCFIARLQKQHRVCSTIFFSNFQYPKKGSKTVRNVVFLSCLTSENINGREILGLG